MIQTKPQTDVTAIVLCGGKGSRMNSPTTHKVCFPIGGVPAILRTLESLHLAGITKIVVVVGSMAGQVMDCVSEKYPDVGFVYQKTPLGTGDAARTGARFLRALGEKNPILVCMGDKVIGPEVYHRAVTEYQEHSCEAVYFAQPAECNPSGGRIVFGTDGGDRGIIEKKDAEAAVKAGRDILIGAGSYQAEAVLNTTYVNAALYLFKAESLYGLIEKLDTSNVQNELYLPDIINKLSCGADGGYVPGKVRLAKIEDPRVIMSYNTVEELLEIEEALFRESGGRTAYPQDSWKSARQWVRIFQGTEVDGLLKEIYGDDEAYIQERKAAYLSALDGFIAKFGDTGLVGIARAPGRVNLMGRHVEHRGGDVNVIAINKEIICVFSPREDDEFHLTNAKEEFDDRSFSLSEHLSMMNWKDWLSYLDSAETRDLVMKTKGNWENYVKASILKLQYAFRDRKIKGMNMSFSGNIPMAAGLSSSSAMVVVSAEAAIAANGLDVQARDFVDLCGEGEWFVGSRGGAGDHAAMKFGDRGYVSRLGFFPFGPKGSIPFPDGCRLVIADSRVKAQKTTNAKDVFNQRIASYEIGFAYLLTLHPELEKRAARIRDINPDTLGCTQSEILEMVMDVPEEASLETALAETSPRFHETIRKISASHAVPERYAVRSVLLYGIAECRRSALAGRYLEKGDLEGFGRMMSVSHDGDRVVKFGPDGSSSPYHFTASDEFLGSRVKELRSEAPDRVSAAQLEWIPGGYACSVPETDFIADLAASVPGVYGAQLSGAGLGGCVMVLVKNEAEEELKETLKKNYYEAKNLEPSLTVCTPVKGSMVVRIS